jgi:hypothetical protein
MSRGGLTMADATQCDGPGSESEEGKEESSSSGSDAIPERRL